MGWALVQKTLLGQRRPQRKVVQNSWVGGAGQKTLLGAGTGPIEKWFRTPGWGGAGPGPESTAGTGPIEKWFRTPTLYIDSWIFDFTTKDYIHLK